MRGHKRTPIIEKTLPSRTLGLDWTKSTATIGVMSLDPKELLIAAKAAEAKMLDELRSLVEIESPSDDRAAVNRAVDWTEQRAFRAGARSKRHTQARFGDHLELRFAPTTGRALSHPPLMLLGHLDTVWPLGTLAKMPFKVADKRVWGPGVLDMKSGVVMALYAIEMLRSADALDREVVLLLNSDEEVGSTTSRAITEALAKRASAVLVLEPGQGLHGSAKTWRKGVGNYTVRVRGVAAHSGVDFSKGHSAIREIARQVEIISRFTELKRGITVNIGTVTGGTRTNVVAAEAECGVDVRIQRMEDAARVDKKMRGLKPKDKQCKIDVHGGINRPPMERSRAGLKLYAAARDAAKHLGFTLKQEGTGGGSDGNFTAALGVPTLDGLGGVGEGAHAMHESILLSELPRRTALLAALIASA